MRAIGDRMGGFVVDSEGKPAAVFTAAAGLEATVEGRELKSALSTEFDRTTRETTLNDVYYAAGKGVPIAVVDDEGRLVGALDPRDIMEEMGRVERLIEGFEREVFM
jgi:glycine betaine/proline transport system ATP-binding protein